MIGSVTDTDKEIIMKTTIPKLRRIIRKTLSESLNSNGLDQRHLDDLADWISQASEDGMEEDYDTTVASYMEACADDGDPVTQEFVEAHLEHILDNHESIDRLGDLIVDTDVQEDEDYDEEY